MSGVSVIVPVHDNASTLARCLDSIKAQKYTDLEIILVDDGSADASTSICEHAVSRDARVRLLRLPHKGATAARKTGLRAARSEYVAFVDADDYLEPDFCACLLELAKAGSVQLAIGGHYVEKDGMTRVADSCLAEGVYGRRAMEEQIFPVLFHNDFRDDWSVYPYIWGKLYRRELLLPLLEQVDDDIVLGEDVCTTFPYVLGSGSLAVTKKPLYHYVQAEGSQFHTHLQPDDLDKCRRIFQLVRPGCQAAAQAGDMLAQLRRYLLTTILLPRSHWLLPELLAQQPYLFPFRDVPRGSRVIIYGAGIFGTALHDFLENKHFSECVLWLDRRAANLRKMGLDIHALSEVRIWPEYDFVLVPIMKTSAARAVTRDLLAAGIAQEKIRCLDEDYATSESVWHMFGLEGC